MEIKTDDLFLAAYVLASGAQVAGVETSGWNGKRVVVVRLTGDALAERERAYLSGQATANVTVLKGQMKHLKDLVFAELRNADERDQKNQRRENYAHSPRGYR